MMRLEGSIAVESACLAARISRAGFYRRLTKDAPAEAKSELRDQVQRVAVSDRSCGYRRVTEELRRLGIQVGYKRVLRIMREDNLLCVRRKKFVLTTQSRHGFVRYCNLTKDMTLTDINQLWVSDITYIRMCEEFAYLAVILDAFSRRVVGWELGESLQASLALTALDRALAERSIQDGIVHHSDQGVQYCCPDYVGRLLDHGFLISMSRPGVPYDNAKAESFMKTLKCEEVYLRDYRNVEQARASIGHFIDCVYNQKRLHSALGYRPPAEFEAAIARQLSGRTAR